jgi:hypothetical protein
LSFPDQDDEPCRSVPRNEKISKRTPAKLETNSANQKKEVLDRIKLIISQKPDECCKNCGKHFTNNFRLFEHMMKEHQVCSTVFVY